MPATTLIARIAAILLIAAGTLHASAAIDHLGVQEMLALFVICASFQVLLGALLLLEGSARPFIYAALAITMCALAAWVLSRTVGLPFVEDGHKEPIGFKDGATVVLELGAVPALLLLLSPEVAGVRLQSPRLPRQALGTVAAGVLVLLVAAMTLDEHESDGGHAVGGDGLAHNSPLVHGDKKHKDPRRHVRHGRGEVASAHRTHAAERHTTHSTATPHTGGSHRTHDGGDGDADAQQDHADHHGHRDHEQRHDGHDGEQPPKEKPPQEKPDTPEKDPPPSEPPPEDDTVDVTIDPGGNPPVVVDLPPR